MTSDDFQVRYRLLKVVSLDDGIRTHNAQETTTGRVVMVHLVYDASPEAIERLRSILSRLPMQDKARILETATLPAGYAIVSEFIPGLTSFSAWLNAHAAESGSEGFDTPQPLGSASMFAAPVAPVMPPAAPPPPPAAPAAAPPMPVSAPGEFTQMFMKSGAASTPQMPPPVMAPMPPAAAPAPPVAAPMAAPVAMPPARPAAPPVAPPPLAPPFAAAPPPAPLPTPVAPPMPAAAPGEFTQMFSKSGPTMPSGPSRPTPFGNAPTPSSSPVMGYPGNQGGPPPMAPPAAPSIAPPPFAPAVPPRFDPPSFASPPVASPPPSSWGGPVDRLGAAGNAPPASPFGASGATSALDARRNVPPMNPSPPIPPPVAPPSFASPLGAGPPPLAPSPHVPQVLPPPVFQAQSPMGLAGAAPSPLAGGQGQPSGAAAGPSDYTMMITRSKGTSVPPVQAKAPEPSPTAASGAKPKIPIPLLIGLNIVLVLALALVLYLALRPKPPGAVPTGLPGKVSVPKPR